METAVDEAPKPPRDRPKGRARKEEVTPEALAAKAFPQPPRALEKGGIVPFEKFWAYRKSLPAEFHDRLTFYVNREWPRLNNRQNLSEQELLEIEQKKRKGPAKYVGQYTDINPDNWRNELLRYHGSGDYKIYLNDVGVRGNPKLKSVNICRTFVSLRDDEFPPVIEDLGILDLSDPINKGYIQQLKSKGIPIPGELPKEESEDMATSVAVEALAELAKNKQPIESVTPVFSELLKQSEQRRIEDLKLLEARHSREMDDLKARLAKQEKSVEERPKESTTVQQVIEMARTIVPAPAPPPQDNGMVKLLTDMLRDEKSNRIEELKLIDARHAREMEAITKRLEALDAREAARMQQQSAIPPPAAAPVAGTSSAIKDVLAVIKGINDLRSGLDGAIPDTGGSGNPWVDLAAELGPRVLDTISNVTTAINKAPAPMTSQGMPQEQQQPGTAVQTLQPQQQDNSKMGQMAQYARMIRIPLIECLSGNPPVPGHRFAGMLIVEYGDVAYNYLCQQGADGVLAVLQAAPDVWGEVQRFGPRVPQFLTEFLDAPRAMEQAQAIRAGQGQRPSMPAGAPPQQQSRPTVVDSPPASQVPQTGGRTILRGDGQPVKTNGPVVNGTIVEPV